MKKKVLGLVSTNYHLLVFLFLKDAFLQDADVDLVVTDKSPYLYDLYKEGRFNDYFRHTFFADAKKIKNPYKSAVTTLVESLIYNPTTKAMMSSSDYQKLDSYDDFYFASPGVPDEIAKELIKTLIKRNKNISLHRFEDGFASYTKPPISAISTPLGRKLYEAFLGYDITQKETELFLFEPTLAEENVANTAITGFSLIQIPKTKQRIDLVTKQIKDILQFESRRFSQPYMFLGQGTENGMQNPITYRSLILDIADHVG